MGSSAVVCYCAGAALHVLRTLTRLVHREVCTAAVLAKMTDTAGSDSVTDDPAPRRAPCGVCLRTMPLKRDGSIRVHGPVGNCCSGSGCPPRSLAASLQVSTSSATQPPTLSQSSAHCTQPSQPNSASLQSTPCPSPALIQLLPSGRILKRIPRSSRGHAASKLATILENLVVSNDTTTWIRLLNFPRRCLRVPTRGGSRWSLARQVNHQVSVESDPPVPPSNNRPSKKKHSNPAHLIASKVSEKLEEGDFRGAVRLACSEDSVAEDSEGTISALRAKHPTTHPDSIIPPPPDALELEGALSVRERAVAEAIRSFPRGSAGGPDGLKPQHLLDLTSSSAGLEGERLLRALTAFTNLILSGGTPVEIQPIFFGASLIALNKKDGGVRPIAVGCTLRRMVAKTASASVMSRMGLMLAPLQLGYGTKLGAEAAVHATRLYLADMPPSHVLLKLDFKNAFNSVRRDKMLEATKRAAPEIFPLVYSTYSTSSSLHFRGTILHSAEGVQQGDPLGPLLFCLVIHPLVLQLESELRVFYLDDGTLGGPEADVLHDFQLINQEAADLGLELNHMKSELICEEPAGRDLLRMAPNLCKVNKEDATLLGSPIGNHRSIDEALTKKGNSLKIMGSRLCHLRMHDALILLRHSLAIPKILYLLRTAPCFSSPCLESFDHDLRIILSEMLNINLDSDSAWSQATLPVGFGGIGVRSAVQLAPSAFLASAAGCSDLIHRILPGAQVDFLYPAVESAKEVWYRGHDQSPPSHPSDVHQKAWDIPRVQDTYDTLLDKATDPRSRARLLACAAKESGAWLNALPVASLGLRMDDDVVRSAVGLRLGVALCRPHRCHQCGADVDELATHGLSCIRSKGRHPRHAAINSIIQRALSTAKIPSTLEPSGLDRSDGKRPDGVTIAPWKTGRPLVWDATCPDTFASSYVAQSTRAAGAVAEQAESVKNAKYTLISRTHHFVPVAIETSGAFGPDALGLVHDIAKRIRGITQEVKARAYLLQQLSVAVQRGNAAALMGTTSVDPPLL